jgi:hypothetical protein
MQPTAPYRKPGTICPHCFRESASDKVCTSLGCGKRLNAPVQLYARVRRTTARPGKMKLVKLKKRR